jgi:hypothetical protein
MRRWLTAPLEYRLRCQQSPSLLATRRRSAGFLERAHWEKVQAENQELALEQEQEQEQELVLGRDWQVGSREHLAVAVPEQTELGLGLEHCPVLSIDQPTRP